MNKCPRCNGPKAPEAKCERCGLKPAHSKDGRLQLCYICNRYCGRTRNFCPHCTSTAARGKGELP